MLTPVAFTDSPTRPTIDQLRAQLDLRQQAAARRYVVAAKARQAHVAPLTYGHRPGAATGA